MQRLTGRWLGTYEYAQPDVPGPRQVGFTLELFDTPSWRLIGEVWDDPEAGVEGTGIISGWSWRRHVWFKKIMPSHYVAQDPKAIPLADYVETEFGERVAVDSGVHVISYRGVIVGNDERLEGKWQVRHNRVVLESKRVIAFPSAHGTWQMRRR